MRFCFITVICNYSFIGEYVAVNFNFYREISYKIVIVCASLLVFGLIALIAKGVYMKKILFGLAIILGIYSFVDILQLISYVFGGGFAVFAFFIFPVTFSLAPIFFALAYGIWGPLLAEIASFVLMAAAVNSQE